MREARSNGTSHFGWTSGDPLLASFNGVKSESAQKPVGVISLAKHFFPEVVRGAGIQMTPLQTDTAALIRVLRHWKSLGVDLLTMKLMMEEFVRHPEWCQRSKRSPWQVFVSRRGDLASEVAYRQRKDPANRRWAGTGEDYWLGRHTPRINYAT
jgi:hypothetical protein